MIDFESRIPFTRQDIEFLVERNPTPFYIYDELGIRKTSRDLKQAFAWVRDVSENDFRNFFAVKALPNPSILHMLYEDGSGADCSSLPELEIANEVGLKNKDIMFTSNDTPDEEFARAYDLGAIINLDDIGHISTLERALEGSTIPGHFPDLISFRYNPGDKIKGNKIIGEPTKTKYGVRDDQLVRAYQFAIEKGAKRFGLHTMMVSNQRDVKALIEQSRILFSAAARVNQELGIDFEFINLGGGIGIAYRPEDNEVDVREFGEGVRKNYEKIILATGMQPPQIVTESGRAITGPHGWLVTKVRHVAEKHRNIVGVDACMANLMRPGMYSDGLDPEGECYHHVSILGKENAPKDQVYDVAGSLCESCDVFARQRKLPIIVEGDYVVIHSAGAHGHAMGFNYNGKLRSAEFLLNVDGSFEKIRRAEKMSDYFATLDFHNAHYSDLAKIDG